jgi:ribosome-associated translation inhibitor RaiA
MSAQGAAEVLIHWSRMTGLRESARHHIESRLLHLAAGHFDLSDIRIAVHDAPQAGHQVKITCSTRGHAITVAQEHTRMGSALRSAVEGFEREVHRLRDRRRDERRLPAKQLPLEPPDLG